MNSFFVQPDKQQAKGSAVMFIFSEVYGALELGINGLDKLIAFFGAIAFANVILLSSDKNEVLFNFSDTCLLYTSDAADE